RDAVSGLRSDHARDRAAGVGHHSVADELRLHLAVGIKDVEQDRLCVLVANGAQVSADLRADAFELMAAGAFFLEHGLAASLVTLELERFLIGGHHVLTTSQLRRFKELGGAGAEPSVRMTLQRLDA